MLQLRETPAFRVLLMQVPTFLIRQPGRRLFPAHVGVELRLERIGQRGLYPLLVHICGYVKNAGSAFDCTLTLGSRLGVELCMQLHQGHQRRVQHMEIRFDVPNQGFAKSERSQITELDHGRSLFRCLLSFMHAVAVQ